MSEILLREFHEASPDAVIVIDEAGLITFANSRVEAILGYRPNELVGQPHDVLIPERFKGLHSGHLGCFMNNPAPRMMGSGLELPARHKDGRELLTEISLSPYRTLNETVVVVAIRKIATNKLKESVLESENSDLRNLLGRARSDVARVLAQAGIDATQREDAERLQRLLLEEMHHRMKNLLATVAAITSQTLRTAESLEQGQRAIENRLHAMGRAQDLLLQTNEIGAQLTDIVGAAIEPFDNHEVGRFVLDNTAIGIGPGAILPLTLSLNELCTNAVKYGALSSATGCVHITTTVDENTQLLTLDWIESGGPAVLEPTRRSFGTRLLGALAGQLHGDVRLRYEPTGVVYQLNIPMALLQ